VDRQAEPAFTFRAVWLPVAAVWVACLEVSLGDRFVAVVLQADHLHLQTLFGDPGLALVAVTFIQVRQVGVLEKAVFISHDWRDFDQFDFFRHDFVLAAIAADFDRGRVNVSRSKRISFLGAVIHYLRNFKSLSTAE
jgi:hypothetical protein